MARIPVPERGTLIISALLLLAIVFTGAWIVRYVEPGGDPEGLLPWFGAAAAVIVVVGLLAVLIGGRRGS